MANNAYIQHKKNDILSMLRIYFNDPDLVPHDILVKIHMPTNQIKDFNNTRYWEYNDEHNCIYLRFSLLNDSYINALYDMVYKVYKEYCDYENQKVKERLKEIAKNERNRSELV